MPLIHVRGPARAALAAIAHPVHLAEVAAMGQVAVEQNGEIGDQQALDIWYQTLEAHRRDNGHPPLVGYGRQGSIRGFEIPQAEHDAAQSMYEQSLQAMANIRFLLLKLDPIDTATQQLFSELHAGGGTHQY